MVLGSEESLALSHAQQLLVIMYYSGPQFVVDHILQSPVCFYLLSNFNMYISSHKRGLSSSYFYFGHLYINIS